MAREVTLYVAVSEKEQAYAGEDGGPARGGKGRWRVGEVGEWIANGVIPLAKRDPDDGLIWEGWLEEVETYRLGDKGQYICTASKQIYEVRPEPDQRSVPKTKKDKAPRSNVPTEAAKRRATKGPAGIAATMKGASDQQPGPVEALTGQKAGRASDQPVG